MMQLREFLLGLVVWAIIVIPVVLLIRYSIMTAFISLDTQQSIARVRMAQELLQSELRMMKILAKDWSLWDEIYQYAQGKNPAFARDYLTLEQLQGLEIDVLMVVDTQAEVVGSTMINQQAIGVVPISPEWVAATKSVLV